MYLYVPSYWTSRLLAGKSDRSPQRPGRRSRILIACLRVAAAGSAVGRFLACHPCRNPVGDRVAAPERTRAPLHVLRSAVCPIVAEVGLDLFLADILGDRLLLSHSLCTETDPLNRNRLLLHDWALLVKDHLVLLLADVRSRNGSTDILVSDRLALDADLFAADWNCLSDVLGHDVLSQTCPTRFLGTGADVESLL